MRESQLRGRDRLAGLRDMNRETQREMDAKRDRFAALADPASRPIVVSAPFLFPTPPHVADRVVSLALDNRSPGRTLEPSAGTGRLYQAFRRVSDTPIVLIEIDPNVFAGLSRVVGTDAACDLVRGDFLSMGDLGTFDTIVANPPFRRGLEIDHIRHALTMLRPGGRLVSICADGPKQRRDLQTIATYWEEIAAGEFEGTRVETAIVVIDK